METETEEETVYYKALGRLRRAKNGGHGYWRRPGRWMPPVLGQVYTCANGYHLADLESIIHWLGPKLYVAEGRGDRSKDYYKIAFREARLVRRTHWNRRMARELGKYIDELKGYPVDEPERYYGRSPRWWTFVDRWNKLNYGQQQAVLEWLRERL